MNRFAARLLFGLSLAFALALPAAADKNAGAIPDTTAKGVVGKGKAAILAIGTLVGMDEAHTASGRVLVARTPAGDLIVKFMRYQLTQGPDLVIYLSAHANPKSAHDVLDSPHLSLGSISRYSGAKTLRIPEGTDISVYHSLLVWCEKYSILFAKAGLVRPGQ